MQSITIKQLRDAITRSKLVKYFSSKPTSKFETGSCHNCAIARYVRDTFKKTSDNVEVDVASVNVRIKPESEADFWKDDSHVSFDLPKWASDFVDSFDSEGTKYVTGKKALAILKGI